MTVKAKRGKKGLINLVFSRIFIFGMMILSQVFLMAYMFSNVTAYSNFINTLIRILAFLLVISIVSEQKTDPTTRLLWSVLILVFPLFGTLMYLYVKTQFGSRLIKKRIENVNEITTGYLKPDETVYKKIRLDNEKIYPLTNYLYNYSGYIISDNNDVMYLENGEKKFEHLMADIKSAQKFIFLEYFIIESGQVWDSILDELIVKQKEGVEIRVMYDGMCSLIQLPVGYYKRLSKMGIKSKPFSPMRPFFSTHQNNRDHRKIAVIDGKIAYNGGINLADEYMNITKRFGYWKDSAVRIEGPCVKNFTLMFLRMWNMSEETIENFNPYLKVKINCLNKNENQGYVSAFSDEPFDDETVAEQVYLQILNSAKKYVHIITPYLVIDNIMMYELKFAAKRGVDVKLVLPGIPDKKYAYCVARTYYEELLEAGVKIYEFTPGFTHAKMMISDDDVATVGTVNLDYRSFYLHFECGTLIFNNPAIKDMQTDFRKVIGQSKLVTMMECRNRSLAYKISGKLLRLIAPLL
ncbi:MAG: cardiolipin synthase [Lachnospiraceae bacterium]|nr:cardiolipin synthase [Lachnospiraceae bacterium]